MIFPHVFAFVALSSHAGATDSVRDGRRMEGQTMHDDQIELPSLNGARVLVVQNDPFIAADLDLMIDDAGGKVVALPRVETMHCPCSVVSRLMPPLSIRISAKEKRPC